MEIFGIAAVEWMGYLASLFVLLSFFMRNIKALRLINTLGCLFFVVYGIILPAWPVAITNGAIVLVNLYYLLGYRKNPTT